MNENKKLALLISGLVFILGSCAPNSKSKKTSQVAAKSVASYQEQEARMSDIPIMLGVNFTAPQVQPSADTIILEGTTQRPVSEIIEFYQDEMNDLGWECFGPFETDRTYLVFTKSSKVCLIAAHVQMNRWRSTTYISLMIKKKSRNN